MSEIDPERGGASRDQARQVLAPMLQARARLAPIGEFLGPARRQAPADPRHVFELRKNGDDYSLHAIDAGTIFTPEAHGNFIFVVMADDPGRILVAIDQRSGPPALRQYGVQGHTSVSKGGDVLYAGELCLERGRLHSWDNASGHYRPAATMRRTNMLPVVRSLLPDRLFAQQPKPLALRVGQLEIVFEDLRAMGARIDGRALWVAVMDDGIPALEVDLANRIQFSADYLVGTLNGQRTAIKAEILIAVAAARNSPKPLITARSGADIPVDTMNFQLGRLKGAIDKVLSGARSNLVNYLMPGGGIVRQTGAGLQVFGIYNSVGNLTAAIERGDAAEAVIQAAGLGAQGASLAAEAAIPALGRALQAGNVARFNAFAASSLGQRLGGSARLGINIGRTGAAAGTVITLPFDLYNAVSSLRQAARASGRDAQDHYVNGGLATASATLSVGTSAAAFAGVSAAGALGFIAGLALAIGGGIYHSVRYVDALDRHAGLSAGERLATGLGSFVGVGASQEIEDRAAAGRAREVYNRAKRRQLQPILQEHDWRVAIYGDAVITPQAPLQRWTEGVFFDPYNMATEWVQQPATVIDNADDDSIDASAGLSGVANRVRNKSATSDTVLWATGDGNDRLLGMLNRANVFSLRRGTKAVRGGARDDIIMLDASPESGSAFDGGDGVDTLVLRHSAAAVAGTPATVRVVLDSHDQAWEWDDSPATYVEIDEDGNARTRRKAGTRVSPARESGRLEWGGKHSALRSIENVITAPLTTTSVTGNGRENVFVLNGIGDSASGMGGDDTYIVNGGGQVSLYTGIGESRFRMGRGIDTVDIRSWSGRHRVMLDFDLADIVARVVVNDLVISLDDDGASRQVRFHDLLHIDGDGGRVPRYADGDLMLYTRDRYALAPMLSTVGSATDGLIELAATPASGPESQAMDLLIQYAGTLDRTPLGVGSAAVVSTVQTLAQASLTNPAQT